MFGIERVCVSGCWEQCREWYSQARNAERKIKVFLFNEQCITVVKYLSFPLMGQ